MAKVVEVYPDKSGTVRNVQVLVKPSQDGSNKYIPSKGYELKRHVSKLLLLVPVEDQDNVVSDVEVEKEILETVDNKEKRIFDGDDGSDAMAKDVGSSSNSPDVEKQDKVEASLEGGVGELPGGNVAMIRCSPRFRQTNA